MLPESTSPSLLEQFQARHETNIHQPEALQKDLAVEQAHTALPIKVLATIGAWLAAILFYGFIMLFFGESEEGLQLGFGVAFVAASILISHFSRKRPLLEPFLLSSSMLGQFLLGIGLVDIVKDDFTDFLWIAISIEAIILVLSKNAVQRFVTAGLILLAMTGLIFEYDLETFFPVLPALALTVFAIIWQKEPQIITRTSFLRSYIQPVTSALAVFGLGYYFLSVTDHDFSVTSNWWIYTSLPMIGALVWTIRDLLKRWQTPNTEAILSLAAVALIPLALTPGILAALLVTTVAFGRGQHYLSGLGVFSLAFYLTAFYYNLEITLLQKSLFLLGSGATLLAARFGFSRIIKRA